VPHSRDPLPDALRALALLGVLIVNAAGYLSSPWGPVLGEEAAREGGFAALLQGLYAFGVQGKALPTLAFLFGMGLALAMRGWPPERALGRARVRQRRLLLLGVLHGLLIYFGDILTLYALVGWLVLRHVQAPWSTLRRTLRRALWWALAVAALLAVVMAMSLAKMPRSGEVEVPEPTFAGVGSWFGFWQLNASSYLVIQLGTLLVGIPLLRLLMLAGIAAARLRWLTHPRWQAQRRRLVRRWSVPALLLNAVYAWAYVQLSGSQVAWRAVGARAVTSTIDNSGPTLKPIVSTMPRWSRLPLSCT
jgi:uncharacterized protein